MRTGPAIRGSVAVFIGAAVFFLFVEPAAAHGWASATTGDLIGALHGRLLMVAVPIALLVEGLIVYTVLRFRNNDEPTPTPKNRRLEIGWTIATALVLVFVGVASFQVMTHPDVTASAASDQPRPQDAVEIQVTGHQWFWSVEYVGENVSVRDAKTIYLPADRPIYVTVTSTDVIHSVHAPEIGLKQDAIPGQENVVRTRITRTGEYRLYCAEYCGVGHSEMRATIRVVSDEEYREWLEGNRERD